MARAFADIAFTPAVRRRQDRHGSGRYAGFLSDDQIFPAEGAHPYTADLNDVEFHLLDTGHFALEENGDVIATEMLDFLDRIND